MMFLKSALTLFLATNASAFVISPSRGCHYRHYVPLRVSLSDPTSSSEIQAEEHVADADQAMEIPAPAELDSEEDNLSNDSVVDAKPTKPPMESERHTIYVGNLPYGIAMDEVKELFTDEGVEVENVSLPRNKESGEIKGFAFIDVSSEEEIPKAVGALNGRRIGDRPIRVSKSLPKDQIRSKKANSVDDKNKLFVGNLPFKATKEDLQVLCSKFGEIKDIFIPVDSVGEPRGFAFVTCSEGDVDAVMEGVNGSELMGRPLIVKPPLKPGEKEERKAKNGPRRMKLYIGNLSFDTSDAVLTEVFEEFGDVHDCYIPQDVERGGSRGFGFITMDEDVANDAIDALNGIELDGREIAVNEAMAKRRNHREF